MKPSCGQFLLNSMRRKRQLVLPETVLTDSEVESIRCGEQLELKMAAAPLVRMALILYGFPILALLLAVLAADFMALGDAATLTLAMLVTGLCLTALRKYFQHRFQPGSMELKLERPIQAKKG